MVIRRVLLDAFGTVFSPSRPVFTQYTDVARSYGLQVGEEQVKEGFKRAFKQWLRAHPRYGKHSIPPLEPGDWWRGVIGDTFRFAGVAKEKLNSVEESLSTSLIQRFWGHEGYTIHSEFIPFLESLERLGLPSPSIVSNTDPALFKILDNLGVSNRQLGKRGIKDEEIFTTWEIEKEKQDIGFWTDVLERLNASNLNGQVLRPEEVLVVGDELMADYETPRQAGLQSLLLRRTDTDDVHANPGYEDETSGRREDVHALRDLSQAITWIEKHNAREAIGQQ